MSIDKLGMLAELLNEAVQTDGSHHKQWYLEEIAELFEIELVEHDEGIAP
jgi:hypothetical protein